MPTLSLPAWWGRPHCSQHWRLPSSCPRCSQAEGSHEHDLCDKKSDTLLAHLLPASEKQRKPTAHRLRCQAAGAHRDLLCLALRRDRVCNSTVATRQTECEQSPLFPTATSKLTLTITLRHRPALRAALICTEVTSKTSCCPPQPANRFLNIALTFGYSP